MTNAELISFINQWVRNSAIDAFNDTRLNTVLLALVNGALTNNYATYEDFAAAITASPDAILIGFVAEDDELTGDENVVLMRVPGVGIGQLAFDLLTEE